jgi:sialate O-acetylesterase
MAGMIQNWRADFGVGQFPFYFAEIAPFRYKGSKDMWSALLRDQQLKASLAIPNTGMASTFDIGEEFCIHPSEKLTVSKRLAYWALSETYGVKGLPYKSPIYKSMTVKDSTAIITFDNIENGLNSFGKEVECFEVAGQDSTFYPATLNIYKMTAVVKSTQVKSPVAVRYGYCNFPKTKGYLYNTAGLPVPSFRTDNWKK